MKLLILQTYLDSYVNLRFGIPSQSDMVSKLFWQ